jgi:hypothetical protein
MELEISMVCIFFLIKPRQNKKGQSFIVMLGFCGDPVFACLFLNLHQLPAAKKHAKTEHHNKRLAFLILSEL